MKLCAVLLLVGVASAARLDNTYLPPGSAKTAGGNGHILRTPQIEGHGLSSTQYGPPIIQAKQSPFSGFLNGPSAVATRPNVHDGSFSRSPIAPSPVYGPANFQQSNNPEVHARIVNADNTNDGSGNYRFNYETDNQIAQNEEGQLKQLTDGDATVVKGSYSYAGDDGKVYNVEYVADENGFQPSGDHIDSAITLTAADAAKTASAELRSGYNYNAQRGYSQAPVQQSFNGYQGYQHAGFQSQQVGFNTQQAKFQSQQAGFKTQQPGFRPQQSGFKTQQLGFNTQLSGFKNQQPVLNAHQTGFSSHDLGSNSQLGFKAQQQPVFNGNQNGVYAHRQVFNGQQTYNQHQTTDGGYKY